MRLLLKLYVLCILTTAPLGAGWFLPEGINKAGEGINKAAEELGELLKNIKTDGLTIKSDPETVKAVKEFNANLIIFNKNFENSAFTKDNLDAFRRSCAFTFIGLCFTTCGIKLLYDSCKEIQAKLNDKENEELAWHEILDWRDAVSPVIGLIDIGIGYKIISDS